MNGRWEKILSQAHIYEYSACDQDVTAVICRENKRYLRYFKIIRQVWIQELAVFILILC